MLVFSYDGKHLVDTNHLMVEDACEKTYAGNLTYRIIAADLENLVISKSYASLEEAKYELSSYSNPKHFVI